MNQRAYKTSIPSNATEVVGSRYPNGSKKTAVYTMDGEMVGCREWYPDGNLDFEYAMREGEKHGYEYRFHANGNLLEKERYRHGRLHGIGKQWAENGRLLVTWRMVNGTGIDLWCDDDGRLAEEQCWPKPDELGYKRLWNSDERTIYEEYFFMLGRGYHGIWREWNCHGRLKRGFPWFFVADRRVRMREYLRAREADASLPPYLAAEDDPHRKLPEEYLRQR